MISGESSAPASKRSVVSENALHCAATHTRLCIAIPKIPVNALRTGSIRCAVIGTIASNALA